MNTIEQDTLPRVITPTTRLECPRDGYSRPANTGDTRSQDTCPKCHQAFLVVR